MRFSWMLVLGFLGLILAMAESASGQSWDWVFVDVSLENAGLEDIFQELESKTDFVFMYGEEISGLTQTYSLKYERSTLKTVLEDLAEQVGMQLSLTNYTIIVKLKPRQETLFRKNTSPPPCHKWYRLRCEYRRSLSWSDSAGEREEYRDFDR